MSSVTLLEREGIRKSEKLEGKADLRVMKRFRSVKRLRKSEKVGKCEVFLEGRKSKKKKENQA